MAPLISWDLWANGSQFVLTLPCFGPVAPQVPRGRAALARRRTPPRQCAGAAGAAGAAGGSEAAVELQLSLLPLGRDSVWKKSHVMDR